MAQYKGTVHSTRSLEDTFDYLARFSSVAEWDPNVQEAADLDGHPVEVGSRFRVVVSLAGRGKELVYEVVECERPDRVRLVAETSMFSSDDLIEVEETATGVLVTYTADLRLNGLFKLAEPLMRLTFGRVAGKAKDGLQEQLAKPAAAPKAGAGRS